MDLCQYCQKSPGRFLPIIILWSFPSKSTHCTYVSNFAHVDQGWVLAIVEKHRTPRTGLIRILDFLLKGLSDSLSEQIIEVIPG